MAQAGLGIGGVIALVCGPGRGKHKRAQDARVMRLEKAAKKKPAAAPSAWNQAISEFI